MLGGCTQLASSHLLQTRKDALSPPPCSAAGTLIIDRLGPTHTAKASTTRPAVLIPLHTVFPFSRTNTMDTQLPRTVYAVVSRHIAQATEQDSLPYDQAVELCDAAYHDWCEQHAPVPIRNAIFPLTQVEVDAVLFPNGVRMRDRERQVIDVHSICQVVVEAIIVGHPALTLPNPSTAGHHHSRSLSLRGRNTNAPPLPPPRNALSLRSPRSRTDLPRSPVAAQCHVDPEPSPVYRDAAQWLESMRRNALEAPESSRADRFLRSGPHAVQVLPDPRSGGQPAPPKAVPIWRVTDRASAPPPAARTATRQEASLAAHPEELEPAPSTKRETPASATAVSPAMSPAASPSKQEQVPLLPDSPAKLASIPASTSTLVEASGSKTHGKDTATGLLMHVLHRRNDPAIVGPQHPFFAWPWMSYLLAFVPVVVLILSLLMHGGIEPMTVNPMVGPSESRLLQTGAASAACMRVVQNVTVSALQCGMGGFSDPKLPDQWWRVITAVGVPRGLVHWVFTAGLTLWLGPPLERTIGRFRFALLWVTAGIMSILAALLVTKDFVILGPNGGAYALLAMNLIDHITGWPLLDRPYLSTARLFIKTLLTLIVGWFPGVANVNHISGFAVGLVLGFALRPRLVESTVPLRSVVAGTVVKAGNNDTLPTTAPVAPAVPDSDLASTRSVSRIDPVLDVILRFLAIVTVAVAAGLGARLLYAAPTLPVPCAWCEYLTWDGAMAAITRRRR
ncbi:hypothetical protein AMAG_14002 [Allomyces macrogynus ATCC 38327]|uniref:Rhomboid-type serine protease n=1 Tax=Allomyces macrogynus (strain ATCC 38327) TaxID=578462 RepID=A0A0L0T338_ALLM3|nr:hypothetical protein AMAG_14002 [Allomyces macrogynus ATCC 38327]|eukprot:KNE69146.1 hypothetical protein AMAG_14002 [Allomyces macrogynus ATCC 38327]